MSIIGEGAVMCIIQGGSPGCYARIMQHIEFYSIFCYNF